MILPSFEPKIQIKRWEYPNFPVEFKPWNGFSSHYPPLIKLSQTEFIVDWWAKVNEKSLIKSIKTYKGDGKFDIQNDWVEAKIWVKEDHPNINKLPQFTPKIVKSIYKAENQLRLLRGGFTYKEQTNLYTAWNTFIENLKR